MVFPTHSPALAACTAHHLALIWHLLALALSPRCAYLTRALRVSDLPTLIPPPSLSLCISVHPFPRVSHCLHTDCVCVCVRARWFLFLCVMHHFGLIRPQIVGIKAWPKAMLALSPLPTWVCMMIFNWHVCISVSILFAWPALCAAEKDRQTWASTMCTNTEHQSNLE